MGDGGEGGNGGRDVAQEEVVGEVEHDEGGRGHRWWQDPGGEAFPLGAQGCQRRADQQQRVRRRAAAILKSDFGESVGYPIV